jgi:hypothetical protein
MTAMKMHTDRLSQKIILFSIIQKVTDFGVNRKPQSGFLLGCVGRRFRMLLTSVIYRLFYLIWS